MIIQYDGTRYDGWQKQGNTGNTIQGKLEAVLGRMNQSTVSIQGAGRTDAGVHALGQTASFQLEEYREPEEICRYMNQYLPEDVEVISVELAPQRFHARLSAVQKTYCYRIGTGDKKQVFDRKYLYRMGGQLDVTAMKKAVLELVGTHDFRSFCSNKRMKKSTIRTLYDIRIEEDKEREQITLAFTGDGFLYHMVRILTGTLIEVGQGTRKPEEMTEILEARNREKAGFTAPALGLTLVSVAYEGE